MRDPHEGVAPDGTIRTGADRAEVPAGYEALLARAVDLLTNAAPASSIYLYGSVATGQARRGASDVDLLTFGVSAEAAVPIARELSAEYSELCRAVEIGVATTHDLAGATDAAYGMRAFVHHYCALLAGPELDTATASFPADRRAARGFNGDIAEHGARWRVEAGEADTDADQVAELGWRVARKTLLAVAGLVSVHDATWTTDRERAAVRWAAVRPDLTDGLAELFRWSSALTTIDRNAIVRMLETTVDPIVDQFADDIGLW